MTDWHVLKSTDGRYAANTWEHFNGTLRRPRASLAPQLNENEVNVVVCLYLSYMDAVEALVRYYAMFGEILTPIPIEFYGQGPRGSAILEKLS